MNWRNVLLIFLIGFLSRILPHPENITPILALSILVGIYSPRGVLIGALLISYCCADFLIALSHDFPMFGSWSFYTYTGIIALVCLGNKIPRKNLQIPFALLGTLGFWVWTNLGVLLHSGMYPKTMTGLISCYIAALPFLQKALVGDLIWFVTLALCFPVIISNHTNVVMRCNHMLDTLNKIKKSGFRHQLY